MRSPADKMARLFREIMSVCLNLKRHKIAYLGPAGTFTHMAALKHFGKAATAVPLSTICWRVSWKWKPALRMYGVVHVRNSLRGVVNLLPLMAFILRSENHWWGWNYRLHHQFLVGEHTKVGAISKIYAHSMAMVLMPSMTGWPLIPMSRRVAVSVRVEAARVSKWSGTQPPLQKWQQANIIARTIENIEDTPSNTTFLIIGRETVAPSGQE